MTDSSEDVTDPGRKATATPQAGVLGNLPRSRPSVRSPRRAAPRPETRAAEPPAGATGQEHASSPADLEALARGGLAIAGGVATLGLRIAGRAAAAVRDTVERR